MRRSGRFSFPFRSNWLRLALVLLVTPCVPVDAGEVRGTVSVETEKRPRGPRRYYRGPYRSGRPDSAAAFGVGDVVIWVDVKASVSDLPERPEPVMTQKDETFRPHVLPVRVGTTVTFPNEDPFYHNVFSVVAGDRFDLGRYAEGDRTSDPFRTPGVVVVRCEIHPGMKAYIVVVETPVFTVPREDGTFRIPYLPAGRHTLHFWHPKRGPAERSIEVPPQGVVDVSVEL